MISLIERGESSPTAAVLDRRADQPIVFHDPTRGA